ncbi:anaphase-promoting complex subunit 5 [Cylas formicarius]|uniref:anaphase-promoting complex subunit 5 n=1 Tax=Cylas formicarius TaxID=197179 RepID=UPI002958A63D|nr:anaphase-promoting complex subunit 5 [Cylas formicarius]
MSGSRKKSQQEMITPYKLSVAILLRSYCQYKDSDEKGMVTDFENVKYKKSFCLLALRVLQGPDLKLAELKQLLVSRPELESMSQNFNETLQEVYSSGVGFLLDIVDNLKQLMSYNNQNLNESKPMSVTSITVSKNSVVGYFLRRFIMYFEKLTFSEVAGLYRSFQRYFSEWKDDCISKIDNTEVKYQEWYANETVWSRRQAELFLATQATLLQNNEEKALSPEELQNKISSILKSNPELAEAHFMSFLNYLRVEEFCGAIQSLTHCFDRRPNLDVKCYSVEKSKEHRYAALNLAILLHHFGHTKEALASLRESIKTAHEANDNLCLQHALSWLYRLSNVNKDNLIVQCIIKTFELNMSYTTSLALQNFAHYASAKVSVQPSVIFETFTKSDMLNCQNNYKDLIFNNNVMKASLWQLYGKTEMCSLWSQMVLYLNIDTSGRTHGSHYGEGYLHAVCNTALVMLLQGEYNLVNAILNYASRKFPNEPHSRVWTIVENFSIYTRALYNEKWLEAESAARKLVVFDKWEGYLKLAELYFYKQEYEEAAKYVNLILKLYDHDEHLNDGKFCFLRAKILSAEIQFAASYPDCSKTTLSLMNCLTEAEKPELAYQVSIIYLNLAKSLLAMGQTTQAMDTMKNPKCMLEVFANGGCYDKARAGLLYVKCLVADSDKLDVQSRRTLILDCIGTLDEVKTGFEKVEAFSRVKDVLYLQAQLYNAIDMKTERNNCSLQYRLLDEERRTKNYQTLIKYL